MKHRTRRGVLTVGIGAIATISGCVARGSPADSPTGPVPYPAEQTAVPNGRPVETADGYTVYRPLSVTVYDSLPYSEYSAQVASGDWAYESVDRLEPADGSRVVVVRMEQTNAAPGADYCPAIGTVVGLRLAGGREVSLSPSLTVVPVGDGGNATGEIHAHAPVNRWSYTLDTSDTDQVDPETTVRGYGIATVPAGTAADEIYPAFGSESAGNGLAAYWENGYDVEVTTDA